MKEKMKIKGMNLLCLAAAFALCVALASCGNAAETESNAQNAAQKNGGGTTAVSIPAKDDSAQGGSSQDGPSQSNPAQSDPAQTDSLSANPAQGDIIQIGEKMFVGQINDIYANPDEYLGKTIRYEGFYMVFDNGETGSRYDYVLRNGPGCCGNDSQVGFEINWDGAAPDIDAWVEVTGEMSSYEEDGWPYLCVNATELKVLPYRGNDTVTQ